MAMPKKLKNGDVLDLFKNRDLNLNPVMGSSEIVKILVDRTLCSRTTVKTHLQIMDDEGLLLSKKIGKIFIYWLPGEKMTKGKKKFQINMGWE